MIGNNEILNYLLIKEDFLPEPTDLGDGKITIGSGLTDSKWLDLYRKRGNKWSKEDNRKAVLEEIQKRRLWAEQNVPHWNSLPEPSQDALLSYRYNYNFTPKNSPKLFKALEDKNYLEAARQIDATSKNPDFKKGLLNRRKEEQQWFLSGFPELSKSNDFAIPYKYPVPEYPTVAEAYRKNMAPITDNYSQGGQLQNHKQWKDLSYSEKNDIIKVAVRNGITTLPEIRQKYNEFADGGNLYASGGYVYDMLPQLFASDGVQVRVTSGYRPNSKVQGSGKPSRHSMHEAADIVGDFSAIRRVLDNPESNTAKWMRANGYGYLDETSKTGTKKFWHDQNGDHSHYHIGKDSGIAKKFAASTGSISDTAPIVSTGNYLDIAKAHIRNNEGWSPMPVADGPKNTGWRSVGYGFNDSGFRAKYPQGISKAYENGITKAQAEQELDYILGNMDSHLRRVYGSKWNSFNDNQKAAILDTYYQRPASVVGRNSAFYNAVMRGDNNAVNYLGVAGYNTRNNDRRKLFSSTVTQMPEAAQTVQQPLFYQPWNPQAASLYTPYSPLAPYPAPIFSPEEQEEYFAKQIAQAQKQQEAEQREKQRQEKADRINRFSLLMNLTDPYSSDSSSSSSTPFVDAVSMLTQRSPIPYFSDGGSIHIKPENRGKFTRLKERTGHSASWFKENGTPAQKKMATFALNSKHWKHGLGGNLFDGGGKKDNNPKPVTTGGAGYIPSTSNIDIRQRLYDNVVPFGYNNPVERIASAVFLNKPSNKQEYVGNRDILDDLWGTYLGIPKNRRHYNPVLKTSKYKPTNSKGSNQDYVSIPFANDDIDHIIKEALWQGERSQLLNPELGTFTVDTGRDKKGQYVSYYDKWDLNPFRGITNVGNKVTNFIGLNKAGDLSFGIGKPIEIYDRIYLDDYYGVPYPYRGATYLPEVTVYGKKKKKALGGNLFKDGGDTKANIPVTFFTQSEAMPLLADNPNRTAVLDEVTVKPYKKLPMQSELFQGITNQSANEKADEFANRTSMTPERFLGLMGANVPLAAGALGATVAAPALFDSTIAPLSDYITGSSIAGVPTTAWLNTGMEASFAGHGLNHAANEGIDGWGDAAMTALEITPLGRVIKPIIKETAAAVEKYRYPLGRPQIPDEYLTIKPQIKSYDNSITKVPFFTWGNDSRFKVSPTKEFYKELYSQLSAAKKYKESPEYADLVRKAAQESENLGIGDFPEDLFTAPNGKSLKLIFEDRPKGELGEYVPKDNVMRLDMLQSEDMEVPYHEGIHWQRVGNPDNIGPNFSKWWKARESGQSDDIQQKLFESFRNSEEYNRYIKRRNADRYLEYKVNNALYPFADAYLRARGELQAHGLEAGRAIGLKPFLPYPGMKSALNAIDKARSYNPYLNDVKSGGEENVKRFWDILTGQYAPSLILSGLTSTGYGLTNK